MRDKLREEFIRSQIQVPFIFWLLRKRIIEYCIFEKGSIREIEMIINDIETTCYNLNLKGGNKMGKIIIKNAVQRKPGYLYYVDGEGNVCEAELKRGGKKKKEKK